MTENAHAGRGGQDMEPPNGGTLEGGCRRRAKVDRDRIVNKIERCWIRMYQDALDEVEYMKHYDSELSALLDDLVRSGGGV